MYIYLVALCFVWKKTRNIMCMFYFLFIPLAMTDFFFILLKRVSWIHLIILSFLLHYCYCIPFATCVFSLLYNVHTHTHSLWHGIYLWIKTYNSPSSQFCRRRRLCSVFSFIILFLLFFLLLVGWWWWRLLL